MKRFFITGLAMSAPGTMGGNTKIALELARHFSRTFQVIMLVPSSTLKTITDNIEITPTILIHPLTPFPKASLFYLLHDAWHYTRELDKAFTTLNIQPGELVFNCSDYLSEAFSSFWLKPKYKFVWLPSSFLFFPCPWENLTRRYGFPVFLYTLAYIYQRVIFQLLKMRGDLFVITNDCDKKYFPRKWHNRIFPFYGGVNVEQIQAIEHEPTEQKYDVVFCSRLCTQKGILPFLDIWSRIVKRMPHATLAIIGNGLPAFEQKLNEKARNLNISHTISLLGYVNNEEKYRIYRASRLFVHPTVYDNNGMVAAEALCTGLPVVMNDLPALREVYTTGCAKTDFSNDDLTAHVIIQLLTDSNAYLLLKPTATQVAELRSQWDWTNRCQQFQRFCAPPHSASS
jgi:glycosyltransferase involved in cell wall biosynthesis